MPVPCSRRELNAFDDGADIVLTRQLKHTWLVTSRFHVSRGEGDSPQHHNLQTRDLFHKHTEVTFIRLYTHKHDLPRLTDLAFSTRDAYHNVLVVNVLKYPKALRQYH